jgi:hypothetical protein
MSDNKRFAVGRQYPAYITDMFRAHSKSAVPGILSFDGDDFIRIPIEPPQDTDCWGPWKYNAENFCLIFDPQDRHLPRSYEVDLERCNTAAAMLDWIFQFKSHTDSAEDVGYLIRAFDDLLYPQQNLCSWAMGGGSKGFNVSAYLTRTEGAAA